MHTHKKKLEVLPNPMILLCIRCDLIMLFSNREYGGVISLITLQYIQIIQCAPRCLVLDIKIWLNWIEAQELFNQNFHLPHICFQSTYLGHISIRKAVISEWVSVNWATLDFKTIGTQLFPWSMKYESHVWHIFCSTHSSFCALFLLVNFY